MRSQIPSVSRVLVILPLLAVGLVAASAFFYIRLDTIVHSDLYRFGLEFSLQWAENYWGNSRLILVSFVVAALFEFITALYILASRRARTAPNRLAVVLLQLIGVCAAIASIALFTRLDTIVHGNLYQFGLQFSEEWAVPYSVNAQSFLSLTGVLVIVNCASLTYAVRIWLIMNIARRKLITWLLLLTGGAVLLLALTYESSISAFVGLGFILWGLVILYAGSERYVEESMLTTFIFPSLANLDRLLEDLDCRGKAFFLPPEFVDDFESCRAYISIEESGSPPKPEHTRGKEDRILLKEPLGVIIEPPGAELTKLLENRLGTRFTKVNLQFLQRELPKVFVEKLQLAKNLEIAIEENRVRVIIDDFVLKDMCEKIGSLTHVCDQIGSPAASAIGCALAKASGKLVSFRKEVISQGGRNLTIGYLILGNIIGEK